MLVQSKTDISMIEENCKFTINGMEFSNGGSWLCKRIDSGKYEGIMYMYEEDKTYTPEGKLATCRPKVGTWDGSIKIPCYRGREYYSNFGDKRQGVWFSYKGVNFYGVHYAKDWSDIVRFREIK